jgi:hypothetical protein
MEGGPRLALVARLAEAVRWDDKVRRHEPDPWSYVRRKLLETEGPLREFKVQLLSEASEKLLLDLADADLSDSSLTAHRESFEPLLMIGDYADLMFNLSSSLAPSHRVAGARAVLAKAQVLTAFDIEALPPDRRPRSWEKQVPTMARRLQIDVLERIVDERPLETDLRRFAIARRLRRNLSEFLSVTRGAGGPVMRDEITPFMLGRLEAVIAASLRLLNRYR